MTTRTNFAWVALAFAGIAGAALSAPAQTPPPVVSDTEPPPPPPDEETLASQPPPSETEPPSQVPDLSVFKQQLSPYGRWVDTPEYGRVWIPNGVRSDWQPYTDGRWIYTDWGWTFASDVPWGPVAFHYGRWGFRASLGWFWVPGFVWAPAWVSWRISDGFVCWAPFGPAGFVYGPRWPGWVVVPAQHFTHPIAREVIPLAHAREIIRTARKATSIERAPVRGRAYGPPRTSGRLHSRR
jgi:hypothetical protein